MAPATYFAPRRNERGNALALFGTLVGEAHGCKTGSTLGPALT
jgi:hypothetical protein